VHNSTSLCDRCHRFVIASAWATPLATSPVTESVAMAWKDGHRSAVMTFMPWLSGQQAARIAITFIALYSRTVRAMVACNPLLIRRSTSFRIFV
jgi:hypothetical protein